MGNTPNNSFPYPEATGLVKDGWEDIKDLATSIDTTLGVYAAPALVKLNNTTFSGVSSQSINNVFTSSYDRYKIMVRLTSGSATGELRFRFRVSGADDTNSVYRFAGAYAGLEAATSGFYTNQNTTSWPAGYYLNGSYPSYSIIEVNQPFGAVQKNVDFNIIQNEGQWYWKKLGCVFTNSTSFDGFTIYGTAGNFTGEVTTYAYKD